MFGPKKMFKKTKTLKIGYKRCEQILVSNSQDIADMDQWTNVTRIYVAGTNTPMTVVVCLRWSLDITIKVWSKSGQ